MEVGGDSCPFGVAMKHKSLLSPSEEVEGNCIERRRGLSCVAI